MLKNFPKFNLFHLVCYFLSGQVPVDAQSAPQPAQTRPQLPAAAAQEASLNKVRGSYWAPQRTAVTEAAPVS